MVAERRNGISYNSIRVECRGVQMRGVSGGREDITAKEAPRVAAISWRRKSGAREYCACDFNSEKR